MKKISLLLTLFSLLISGCAEFSQTTEKAFTGLSIHSGNVSDAQVEEEAQEGQMRNIK